MKIFAAVGSLLAVLMLASSLHLYSAEPAQRLIVKVVRVHPSPHIWTGLVATSQSFDAIIQESDRKDLRRGDRLNVLVSLLHGSPLFDRDEVAFSPSIISVGKFVVIKSGRDCHLPDDGNHYGIDPSCITVLHPQR